MAEPLQARVDRLLGQYTAEEVADMIAPEIDPDLARAVLADNLVRARIRARERRAGRDGRANRAVDNSTGAGKNQE